MDSIRSYSNRSDLLEDLDRAVRQLSQALAEPSAKRTSVTSTGRVGRQWALQDRLSEEDVRGLVEAFNVGTPKWKLAKRYNISVSSVKRLLRLHRAAAWIVTHEV